MSIAPQIRAMGVGPSRGRNLDREEARRAMEAILNGTAAPEAVGALFMLMRYRGEVAEEIAGFVDAMRAACPLDLPVTLDWPSYAAGRTRGLPWFLLSARLVAQAGARVLIHGWNSHQDGIADVRAALPLAGIEMASGPALADALHRYGIAYLPLEALSPELLRLVRLRDVLGLRSPLNTALRAFNPARAGATVQGVFHPSYRALQQDSAALLGQADLAVLKGGGGEFERHPAKDVQVYGLSGGRAFEVTAPATRAEKRRLAGEEGARADLAALWSGAAEDSFATEIVIGTAALALAAAGIAAYGAASEDLARDLWSRRNTARAA